MRHIPTLDWVFTSAGWLINLQKTYIQYCLLTNQVKLPPDVRLSIMSKITFSLLTEDNRQWVTWKIDFHKFFKWQQTFGLRVSDSSWNSVLSPLTWFYHHVVLLRVMLVTVTKSLRLTYRVNYKKLIRRRWDSQTWLDDSAALGRFGYLRGVAQPHAC